MKKLLILIIVSVLCMFTVLAEPVDNLHEQLTKNEIYSKIDLEHKGTRKYFSEELTRQREVLFKEADDRASYYEKEGKSMLTTTYFKLSLAWGGIVFFIIGITQVLRLKTERTRFNKLQKNLSQAVIFDIRKSFDLEKLKEGSLEYTIKPDIPVIQDKVQDIIQAKTEAINKRKLEEYYRKEDKKQPQSNLVIGEDIVI